MVKVAPPEKIPYRRWQIILETFDVLLIVISFILVFYYWPKITGKVPTHYNVLGKADAWGHKGYLLFIPILQAGMYALITICERFPKTWNVPKRVTADNEEWVYGNMKNMLCILKFSILLLCFYIQYCTLKQLPLSIWFLILFLVIIFLPIIYFTIRSYRPQKK